MRLKPRLRTPSHAAVVAYLALFVAMGGTSYAAVSITGKDIKNGTVTGKDLAASTVTGRHLRNGSVTGADIKRGTVPVDRLAGRLPVGPAGPAGPVGPAGAAGTPNLALFYDKAGADARFAHGAVTWQSVTVHVPPASTQLLLAVPGWGHVNSRTCNAAQASVVLVNDVPGTTELFTESNGNTDGTSSGTNWLSEGPLAAPSGWAHFLLTKPGAQLDITVHSRWNLTGCTHAITAALQTG